MLQKWQIKAEEVMVLDHIGILLADQGAKICNQAGLVLRSGSVERGGQTTVIANGHHEDTPTMRVERGRLQIELQAVKIVVDQATEVDTTTEHQVLLNGSDSI